MCARYATPKTTEKIERFYGARQLPQNHIFSFKHEMFPSLHGLYLFQKNDEILYTAGYWSLQYRFKKDTLVTSKFSTFNAKSETVNEKETFKHPWYEGYRCIIPLTYFVEWRGEKGSKQPLAIRPKNQEIFSVAGIYEPEGRGGGSYTMLTCEPNEQMSKIHHRMPVIIDDWKSWLDPKTTPAQAKEMCVPYANELQAFAIKK